MSCDVLAIANTSHITCDDPLHLAELALHGPLWAGALGSGGAARRALARLAVHVLAQFRERLAQLVRGPADGGAVVAVLHRVDRRDLVLDLRLQLRRELALV